MREKIIYLITIILVLIIGIIGSYYFLNHNNKEMIIKKYNNVTIKENDSINESIKKIYNSVVVVEAYNQNRTINFGSGFVYKKDSKYGYILTNYHVVSDSSNLKIVTMNGDKCDAKYLGGDNYADIAVIRIPADKVLDIASIGDSTKAKLGNTVFTVGTPINSEYIGSVTKGIISGENRTITVSDDNGKYMMEVLQTDASINPGNSGGPLVNINGEVIGITSMKLVTDSIEGMGFAIPIEIAMSSVKKLEKGEEIQRPYVGISLYELNSLAFLYNDDIKIDKKVTNGVVVASVEQDSSAKEAGLQKGDVITEIDGTKIKNSAHLKFIFYKHEIGDTVKVKINRNGEEKTLNLKLTQSLGE